MGMTRIKGKEYIEAGEVQTGGISDSTQIASGVVGTSALCDVLTSTTWSTATSTDGTIAVNTGLQSVTGFNIACRGDYFIRDCTVSTSQITGKIVSGSGSAITATSVKLTFWAFE